MRVSWTFAVVGLATAASPGDVIPGKYVVKLNPSVDLDVDLHARWVSDTHSRNLARRGGDSLGIDSIYTFPGFTGYSGSFDDETIEAIRNNADVLIVEPDQVVTFPMAMDLVTQEEPSWALSAISNANPPSSDSVYTYDSSAGEGIFAYVIDSGIYLEHDEFEGRASAGYAHGPAEPSDRYHGTHVAGCLGGAKYGVAKKVSLIDVQFTANGLGSMAGVMGGLNWTVNDILSKDRVGKAIINMSLGGGHSDTLNDAIQAAIDDGIIVVAAAGNANEDASNMSPANQPNVITVAASNKDYQRWEHSNYGSVVDIFAPGQDITAAWVGSPSEIATHSGTSEAAPVLAGVIAYLLALEGKRTQAQMWERLQELAIRGAITDTMGIPNLLVYNGNGR